MEYQAVIGLEVHAELLTATKMFCSCPVLDPIQATPNTAVCPICSGMPGVLPVVNRQAVAYAIQVALALHCQVVPTSTFERKNYFYPDLPKGYQISQYKFPLARDGYIRIETEAGDRKIQIRRVHLEEDTGKLSHINGEHARYSLVDLNRAGIPLLEIVTEPDMHTVEEVREYAYTLRKILQYLKVNSGDMQKGVIRIEPNVSIRHTSTRTLGTRVEIKNLNSFRAVERGVTFEINRQMDLLKRGGVVHQETRGWDESNQVTVIQRSKEGEADYRYFPEPDIPPLVLEQNWIDEIREQMPELPDARYLRFQTQYGLSSYTAGVLTAERETADFFEAVVQGSKDINADAIANWVSGDLFGLMNEASMRIGEIKISPDELSALIRMVMEGKINKTSGSQVLAEMFRTGKPPDVIVSKLGLKQISDSATIQELVRQVLEENPVEVWQFISGKETLTRWFFGQVMKKAKGQANPKIVQDTLEDRLKNIKQKKTP